MYHTISSVFSLFSLKCPYGLSDNAVAESTYNIIKLQFFDYVNWYNNHRIHGSLGYLTPSAFRLANAH